MTDITRLFMTDPLKLTDENIDEIIKAFREMRHTFNSAPEKKAAPAATKLTAKQQAAQRLNIDIEI